MLRVCQQALTLGLLRGLEESPVDAPLTERDLANRPESKNLSIKGHNQQKKKQLGVRKQHLLSVYCVFIKRIYYL